MTPEERAVLEEVRWSLSDAIHKLKFLGNYTALHEEHLENLDKLLEETK